MKYTVSHRVATAVLLLAIAVAAVPAAGAVPAGGSHRSSPLAQLTGGTAWLEAAWVWFSGRLGVQPQQPAHPMSNAIAKDTSSVTPPPPPGDTSNLLVHPNTGPCIDPNGHIVPCH